jgi:hypothetical protein
MYPSVTHTEWVDQSRRYWPPSSVMTSANNKQPETFIHQATARQQVEAHPGITSHRRSVSSGTYQVPRQIYQTPPARSDSVPLGIYQPPQVYSQNFVQNRRKDAEPVSWPPTPRHNPIPGNSPLFTSIPPPRRPPFYDGIRTFDFVGAILSSGCNRDTFIEAYQRENGFPPSQAAWGIWEKLVGRVVATKIKLEEERQHAACSSSSDAPTKETSSRNSVAGDAGNVMTSDVGSNGNERIKVLRQRRERWKDITDMTWAFGEPERDDDPDFYITHVAQAIGWQADPSSSDSEE